MAATQRAWNSTFPARTKGLARTPLRAATRPLEQPSGWPAGTSKPPRKPRKPLRPFSRKRARENRERRAMTDTLWPGARNGQDRPLCTVWQARLTAGLPPLDNCTRWADDVNEVLSRAQGGSITDPGNVNSPCRPCHDVLTFTPQSELGWARKLGLTRSRKWGGRAGAA